MFLHLQASAHAPQTESLTHAIILAGGKGTRLREAVSDVPKSLAPIRNQPFLFYIINYLRSQGITNFTFSLGYKHEQVLDYLRTFFPTLAYNYVLESEPLGTGGAISLALREQDFPPNVLVANGDTLYEVDLTAFFAFHISHKSTCSLALKPMTNFDRYGSVSINGQSEIIQFEEKKFKEKGLINGGLYILHVPTFLAVQRPLAYSFETHFLQSNAAQLSGYIDDGYFIDIGIPEDYLKASAHLSKQLLDIRNLAEGFTLFLDRDGVINEEIENGYVLTQKDFVFLAGVKEALKKLSSIFVKIVIVTNQRCVAKGLLKIEDLEQIHRQMVQEIEDTGGRIDGIIFCPDMAAESIFRKPNPGMLFAASKAFPEINLRKSILVGNRPSDIVAGQNAGCYTILVDGSWSISEFPSPDYVFQNLSAFGAAVE